MNGTFPFRELVFIVSILMLDKGLIKLFESILGRLPAFSPWFWRCKGIRKFSDNQVFFINIFSQPFPQPFPFSATVPILTSWPYNKKNGGGHCFPCYSFPRYSSGVMAVRRLKYLQKKAGLGKLRSSEILRTVFWCCWQQCWLTSWIKRSKKANFCCKDNDFCANHILFQ